MCYSPFLYNVSRRYTKNTQDAEDALQDAWINIFRNLDQYKEEGRLEAWMKRIVINAALSMYRKKWSSVVLTEESFELEKAFDPCIIKTLEVEDMMRYIKQLPSGYQEIFTLYVIDEFKHEEIGEMLGIGPSTSRAKLSIARKKLKAIIQSSNKIYQYEAS